MQRTDTESVSYTHLEYLLFPSARRDGLPEYEACTQGDDGKDVYKRQVYGLALGGAVLFYCFYFGQLAWYVLMLAVCLPLFSLVVSLSLIHI